MLFVALDGGLELKLPASNFWICDDPDHSAARQEYYAKPDVLAASKDGFPAVFLSFPSTKDSEWSERFPGKSTAHIIAEARLDWFDQWRETTLVSWLPSGCTVRNVSQLPSSYVRSRICDLSRCQLQKHRGHAYNQIKLTLTERLLEPMFKEFPHLRGKVVFSELGTPLSTEHYLGTPHSYGLAHTPARFRQVCMR